MYRKKVLQTYKRDYRTVLGVKRSGSSITERIGPVRCVESRDAKLERHIDS